MFKKKKTSNMDAFVAAVRKAMELANHIDGIDKVRWNISYNGRTEAVETLVRKMTVMMNEVNGNGTGTVDGKEVAA